MGSLGVVLTPSLPPPPPFPPQYPPHPLLDVQMKSNLEEHLAKAAAEQVRKVIGETVKKSVRDELKGMNVGKGGGVDVDEVEAKVRDALGPMEKEVREGEERRQ